MSGRSKDIACAYGAAAVTKSDSTVIPTTRALWVGDTSSGTAIAVRMANGDLVTFASVFAGQTLPWQVDKVLSTGTSVASIIALY